MTRQSVLRVRGWDRLYENNRSRELGQTRWFPMPNDLSAHRYVELVAHEDGAAHFAVWVALLMVASRATPRGLLVREDARPHTPESLALATRLSQNLIETAIERLLRIGLLEFSRDKLQKRDKLASHPGAAKSQAAAVEPQEGATEGKGTEHHHQEGNRTESELEQKRTERPQLKRKAVKSVALENFRSSPSPYRATDDDDKPAHYASPDEELKAIYQAKTGEPITFEVLDSIRSNLEFGGVAMSDFVAEVKKNHAKNEWRNPPGFLRNLAKHFRSKTQTTSAPVTAAEAAEKNYRCARCGSSVRGEGAVLDAQGKPAPCTCASREYIAHLRSRGVFGEGVIQ